MDLVYTLVCPSCACEHSLPGPLFFNWEVEVRLCSGRMLAGFPAQETAREQGFVFDRVESPVPRTALGLRPALSRCPIRKGDCIAQSSWHTVVSH